VTARRRLRTRAAIVASAVGLSLLSACGGSPSGPGTVTPPPPPPPANTPPVIDSIAASTSRTEVDTDVTLTATVRDAETPVSQLTFAWSADVGTFSGSGPTVTWRVAKGVTTPADHTVKLTVTENYGSGQQNTVSGTSPAIRVHDSPKELGDMGLTFLRRFGDSSNSPKTCLVDFSEQCVFGHDQEYLDIDYNRRHYVILSYSLGEPRVFYTPGQNNADVFIRANYTSRVINCGDGWDPAVPCAVNSIETSTWDGELPSVYEGGRWWICESHALPIGKLAPSMRLFFGPSSAR
jgi:hypothetical protein